MLNDLLEHNWRIDMWIASWLDVCCGTISVMTFTFYRPMWDFEYRCWSSKRRIRRMMRSNAEITGRTLAQNEADGA